MPETNLQQRVSKLEQMMDSLLHNVDLPAAKKTGVGPPECSRGTHS